MSSSNVSTDRFTGRVKWFNNKAGYGFITVTDGPKSGSDVFVHHSSINVDHEQYKYLIQGEYIEFCLNDTNCVGEHEIQAGDVSGIKGGKLMCETRNESRVVRSQYRSSRPDPEQDGYEPVKTPRSKPVPRHQLPLRARSNAPRDGSRYEPRSEQRYEPRNEQRYEPRSETRYEPRSETRYEPRSEPHSEPRYVTKSESVQQPQKASRGRGRPSKTQSA